MDVIKLPALAMALWRENKEREELIWELGA